MKAKIPLIVGRSLKVPQNAACPVASHLIVHFQAVENNGLRRQS
jgi:hypothetical protein